MIDSLEFVENAFIEGVYNARIFFPNNYGAVVSWGTTPIDTSWDARRPYAVLGLYGEEDSFEQGVRSEVLPDGFMGFLTFEEVETILFDLEEL